MSCKLLSPAMISTILVLGAALASAAQQPKPVKLNVAQGGAVNVVNGGGSVTVHAGAGNQVIFTGTTHSNKVEIDSSSTPDGRRVDIRTHVLSQQRPSADEAKVDYDITVPAGVSVSISTSTAAVTVEKVRGDLTLASDTGQIVVHEVANSHVHINSVAAPVILANVSGGYIDITSTSGSIAYQGDCAGGDYVMTSHSGAIDVNLPESASVDLTARSVQGSVENDFPLQPKPHPPFVPSAGRSFAGTSNSGSSSVELQ